MNLGDAWKAGHIPQEQMRKYVAKELFMLHKGHAPEVFAVAGAALNTIPGQGLTLLDMGCASGYYSEVIATLCGDRFEYTGADYSDAMLDLAREQYPDCKFLNLDIRNLQLPDKSFDVVFTGAMLMHIKDWQAALRELARVAARYLVLHRTPVTEDETSNAVGTVYGGVHVLLNAFSREELVGILAEYGFVKVFEKPVYTQIPFPKEGQVTYVFERVQAN